MSDNTNTAEAPTPTPASDLLRPVERKDEAGKVIASLKPVALTVRRGECKGVVYPGIVVTKDNFNDYLALRGEAYVLDKINAQEALTAQMTLDRVLDPDNDWVETTVKDEKTGKEVTRWDYIKEKLTAVLDKFYEVLVSGKVTTGETIADLEEEQETLVADITAIMTAAVKPENAGKAAQMFQEAAVMSAKHQEMSQRIADIRAARTPRKTKAQKAAEALAKANAAGQKAA